ncbi:ethylene receptor 2-like [Diospyros lotus]|uniref:ethylene receptor 2-like n=1 Tax=Diospyros lotus TaxID=55363 RepID=UPI002257108B|nr:ethylene receptor 2-like [Diospyros lotus]XP_052208322.1 ethylene receptor 2-like [Diospyros lotus]
MLKTLASVILISSFLSSASSADNGYPRCDCTVEGFLSAESIMQCQKASDLLIAVAYFSIPIELLYFVSCSNLPFKWVLFEFIAFIVLCGMTHLLTGWTYGPHSFHLMLALTVFKFLTALVSFATAITLLTLFPLLLKVKVRELLLKKKAWDLGREVGIIKKRREAGWCVRMLTQEIRRSLNRHTILDTTLVELSKTLDLQNCAVWMPNEDRTEMVLTRDLKTIGSYMCKASIPIGDPDVREIKGSEQVKMLGPGSALAASSARGCVEFGPVAAIRMPMLTVADFKGGTPQMIQTCYAVLVLVLPGGQDRWWSNEELEIVKVVAAQVAVAISHAAVFEESHRMRNQLVERNRVLQWARQDAMMASQARNSFQQVMNDGMRRPMHSILGLLSLMQDEKLSSELQILVKAMVKTSSVLSTVIDDVMDISIKNNGRFPLQMRSFQLHSMIKEAACLARCLCVFRGYEFEIEVEKSLPNHVMGDDRRVFQVILNLLGDLLSGNGGGGCVTFRVSSDRGSRDRNAAKWATWRPILSDGYVCVRFEIGIRTNDSTLGVQFGGQSYCSDAIEECLSFNVCERLVQLMQGHIFVVPNSDGFGQSITVTLHFHLSPPIEIGLSETGDSSDHPHSNSLFRGLQVLVVDGDDMNRAVTRKLLKSLGCMVSDVASGYECLNAVGSGVPSFQILLLDLHLQDLDALQIAVAIRKFRTHSWPLIIALTSSAVEDIWERCLQIGMNGVLRKPVLLEGMAEELRRVLMLPNRDA